jgi:hypothetical protein
MKKSNDTKGFRECQFCQTKLTGRNKKYCNNTCLQNHLKKNKKYCQTCQKPLRERKSTYCSHACRTKSKQTIIICQNCGNSFEIHDAWAVKNRGIKYCSDVCMNEKKGRKYDIDESYFSDLNKGKIITLGQIICIGYIRNWRTITMISDFVTLTDINNKLSSNYKIVKSDRGLWRLEVISCKMVLDLIGLGLELNPMYQELPSYDWELLLEGMKKTHVYGDGWVFRSFRLAQEVKFRLGGEIVSQYWRDVHKDWMFWEWRII